MQWITGLVAHLGTHGAYANVSQALSEEREAGIQVDRLLTRFAHPAGRARTPVEPAPGACTGVA